MSAIVAIVLTCDGVLDGEVCDAELMAPDDVRKVQQMRTVAYRDHGWSTRGSRDLCPDCRRREPDTAPVASSAERRRAILAAAIREQGGEWTTHRVKALYRDRGYDAPLRGTARDDLKHAARTGLLVLNETPGRRYYTPKETSRG